MGWDVRGPYYSSLYSSYMYSTLLYSMHYEVHEMQESPHAKTYDTPNIKVP